MLRAPTHTSLPALYRETRHRPWTVRWAAAVARFWNGAVAAQRTATDLTPAVMDANLALRRASTSCWSSELHTFAACLGTSTPLLADHALYVLRAVIRHVGGSAQGGHYVAYAQCGTAERSSTAAATATASEGCNEAGLFNFDDLLVRPTSREQALKVATVL